jgi:hypothetical protein
LDLEEAFAQGRKPSPPLAEKKLLPMREWLIPLAESRSHVIANTLTFDSA